MGKILEHFKKITGPALMSLTMLLGISNIADARIDNHRPTVTTTVSKASNTVTVSKKLHTPAITRSNIRTPSRTPSRTPTRAPYNNHSAAANIRAYGVSAISASELRVGWTQSGQASWYGGYFAGRLTANGTRFNPQSMTAANKQLPMGTRILVTNVSNGKSAIVTVNDRGPYYHQRILDLSEHAAEVLSGTTVGGRPVSGLMNVRITVLYVPS
jgi:rare lipoprotein A (peptidoglycan hydrolase)